MDRLCGITTAILILFAAVSSLAAGPGGGSSPERFEAVLAHMHPDYSLYVGSVRLGPSRRHPPHLYMGLVRPGGRDPSRQIDAPFTGPGVRNDIIVYEDSRAWGRSDGWEALLIDHEYFHARHLARGDRTPMPSFDSPAAQRHYLEAAAWGYNLQRAEEGAYASLTHADYREAFRNYTMHFEAFRDYILRKDQPAWAHYQRFLPDPWHLGTMHLARK